MTKILMTTLALTSALILALPANAAFGPSAKGMTLMPDAGQTQEIEKRRPRHPGGSGCDSPRDIAEHPECRA